jgi:hypothetical protein
MPLPAGRRGASLAARPGITGVESVGSTGIRFVDQNTCTVIPGRRASGEPGIQNDFAARLAVWMPGSREDARSGMGGSASRNNEEDRSEMP